jgi:hypothetical protein
MSLNEVKSLKYYLAYAALVIGFFAYSGAVGWKWFNPTQTTHEKSQGQHRGSGGRMYYYHK